MVRTILQSGPTFADQPRAAVRNPFRSRFLRDAYDGAVCEYDARGKTFFAGSDKRRIGSAYATQFWRGFDGISPTWDRASKQSQGYAMWCAGRDIRRAIVAAKAEGDAQ